MKHVLLGCLIPLLMEVGGCGPSAHDVFLMEFSVLAIGAGFAFLFLLLGRWLSRRMRPKSPEKTKPAIWKCILIALIAAIVIDGLIFLFCWQALPSIVSKEFYGYEDRDKSDLRLDLFGILFAAIVETESKGEMSGPCFFLYSWNYWLADKEWNLFFGKGGVQWPPSLAILAWQHGMNILSIFAFIFIGTRVRKCIWVIPIVFLLLNWALNIVVYRAGGYG